MQQLEEIRQMNKKNHQMQCQKKKEDDKLKKDKEEAVRRRKEDERAAAAEEPPSTTQEPSIANFSKSMRDIMEGVQVMDTDKQLEDDDDTEHSPLKKCPSLSKMASRRTGNHLVSPVTEQESVPQAAT